MISNIDFINRESNDDAWSRDTLKYAIEKFKADGCLCLKGLFQPDYLESLLTTFYRISGDLTDSSAAIYKNGLHVGDQRIMIPAPFKSAFNDPNLYANPGLYNFIKEVLGEKFIMNGFGAVVAFPNAPDQHVHRDHPPLYGTPIDDFLPPFAVTVIIPLVELNALSGTTRMWQGSHLLKYILSDPEKKIAERPYCDPLTGLGDILLMDYRLYHGGLANRSDIIRPILYLTYSRPWFRDYVNYQKHMPLKISQREYMKIPQCYRHLFSHLYNNDQAARSTKPD